MTVVVAVCVPPGPDAVMVYCFVTSGQAFKEPFGSTLPIPWSIEVLVAFVDDQAKVAHWPGSIEGGFAEIEAVGAGVGGGSGAGGGGGGGAATATGGGGGGGGGGAGAAFGAPYRYATPNRTRY